MPGYNDADNLLNDIDRAKEATKVRIERDAYREALKHITARLPVCDGCISPDISLMEHFHFVATEAVARFEKSPVGPVKEEK